MTITSPPPAVHDGPRWRPSGLVSAVVMGGLLAAFAAMAVTGQPGELGERLNDQFSSWWLAFASIPFLIFIPGIFVMEYFFPAQPAERTVGPSVGFDLFYFAVHLPAISVIGALLANPISDFLDTNASWLVIDSTDGLPVWLMGILGIAIVDLGVWVSHFLKHKIPLFWRFHMIHHSQPRMSLFTANRTHPVDALIDVFITLLPYFILFPSFVANANNVFIVSMATGWLVRFEHANIRTNLGPLRWIFVTPQSHRIHHSTEPEHWNSNYANVFSIWDRLFRTQHPNVTDYPTTGINDRYFPEPDQWSLTEFARCFIGQMLFPFDTAAVKRASVGSPNDARPGVSSTD